MPPFILAMVFLAVFYVKLHWFQPGRIDMLMGLDLAKDTTFHQYTGMLTLDGLLNLRFDVFIRRVEASGHAGDDPGNFSLGNFGKNHTRDSHR